MPALRPRSRARALLGGVSTLLAAAAATAPAAAQEEGASEVIVITAERREQNIQDVSLAVTVLNEDLLSTYGVDNVSELQFVAPSVAINTYNRSTFINIRGVGIAQSAPTSTPGVAYYMDGVFIPHEQFIGHSFYDLEAIEVLRGPQGTLTGQNSTGGAVYVRTPSPVIGEWSGYIDQTIGDYDWLRTSGAVNVPLGGFAALRLSGVRDERDSFTDNIGPARAQPGDVNLNSWRAALLVDPGGPFTLNLRYEEFDNDTFHNAIKNRNDAVTSDPFIIEEDAESRFNQEGYRASIEARYVLPNEIALRWLSSHQDGFTFDISDGDRTATEPPRPPASNVGRISQVRTDFVTSVHEFNILSPDDKSLQWVVGAFYLDEEVPVILQRDNNNTVVFVSPTSDIQTVAENTSQSVFGQLEYQMSDAWRLIVGARYSEDEQVYTRTVGPPPILGTSSAESEETTGRVALNWTPQDDLLVYGSIARGYKAGGVNLNIADGAFGPEVNNVAEVGVKSTVLDGRLVLNGAAFLADYENIQLATLAGVPPLPVTQNASGGRSYGLELEGWGALGALQVNFGAAYLEAEFEGDSLLNDAIINGNALVLDGDPLPFSPEWTLNGGAQYDFTLANGQTLSPRVQFAYIGEQLATPFRHVETVVPEHTVWDAKLIYEPADAFRIEAFVTNLFDETYIASQIQDSSSASGGIIYGAPRQIGVRLRARFN